MVHDERARAVVVVVVAASVAWWLITVESGWGLGYLQVMWDIKTGHC